MSPRKTTPSASSKKKSPGGSGGKQATLFQFFGSGRSSSSSPSSASSGSSVRNPGIPTLESERSIPKKSSASSKETRRTASESTGERKRSASSPSVDPVLPDKTAVLRKPSRKPLQHLGNSKRARLDDDKPPALSVANSPPSRTEPLAIPASTRRLSPPVAIPVSLSSESSSEQEVSIGKESMGNVWSSSAKGKPIETVGDGHAPVTWKPANLKPPPAAASDKGDGVHTQSRKAPSSPVNLKAPPTAASDKVAACPSLTRKGAPNPVTAKPPPAAASPAKSSPMTTQKSHYFLPLRKGERCAVWMEPPADTEPNGFGWRKVASWMPAKVVLVRAFPDRSRELTNKVTVKLDCGPIPRETVIWTASTDSLVLRLLVTAEDGYERLESPTAKEPLPDPSELQVGDATLCWFQQGNHDRASRKWYPGRVARIDGDKCSVAYDDQDWENEIPFRQPEVLVRLSDGFRQPEWMLGMSVSFQDTKGGAGIVRSVETDGRVVIQYESRTDTKAYSDVVKQIMGEAEGRAKERYHWEDGVLSPSSPSPHSSASTETFKTPSSAPSTRDSKNDSAYTVSSETSPESGMEHVTPSTGDSLETVPSAYSPESVEPSPTTAAHASKGSSIGSPQKPQLRPRRAKKTPQYTHFFDPEDFESPDLKPAAKTTVRRKRKTLLSSGTELSGEDGICSESKEKLTSSPHPPRARSRSSTANGAVSRVDTETNALAVKSATQNRRRRPPTRQTGTSAFSTVEEAIIESDSEDAIVINVSAPLTIDGESTRPRKMISANTAYVLDKALTSSYCLWGADVLNLNQSHRQLQPNPFLQEKINSILLDGPMSGNTPFPDCQRMDLVNEVANVTNVNIPWADFWDKVTLDLYTAAGDDRRMQRSAVQRIATSLHAKSIAAESLLARIEREAMDPHPSWVAEIRNHPKGEREAFQRAINALVSLWVSYGHFYLGTEWRAEDISPELREAVQFHAHNLLCTLGKLASYVGHVYGKVSNEDFNGLAYFISTRVRSELSRADLSKDCIHPMSQDDYLAKVMFQIVCNLDRRVLPQVRPALANCLDISSYYNQVFGG